MDGGTITLDGSGSTDADNDPITYVWTIVSKPNASMATLTGQGTAKPTFKPDVMGDYTIRLEARDGRGLNGTNDVTITVGGTQMTASSTTFAGGHVPVGSAGPGRGGNDVSPAISIANAPSGTKFFAIVMDDDTVSPLGNCGLGVAACAHWSLFNLPAATTSLPEGASGTPLAGVVQGYAYNGKAGYQGPNPPAGETHTYTITVYAMGQGATAVTAGTAATATYTRASFEAKYKDFILGQSKPNIVATFP